MAADPFCIVRHMGLCKELPLEEAQPEWWDLEKNGYSPSTCYESETELNRYMPDKSEARFPSPRDLRYPHQECYPTQDSAFHRERYSRYIFQTSPQELFDTEPVTIISGVKREPTYASPGNAGPTARLETNSANSPQGNDNSCCHLSSSPNNSTLCDKPAGEAVSLGATGGQAEEKSLQSAAYGVGVRRMPHSCSRNGTVDEYPDISEDLPPCMELREVGVMLFSHVATEAQRLYSRVRTSGFNGMMDVGGARQPFTGEQLKAMLQNVANAVASTIPTCNHGFLEEQLEELHEILGLTEEAENQMAAEALRNERQPAADGRVATAPSTGTVDVAFPIASNTRHCDAGDAAAASCNGREIDEDADCLPDIDEGISSFAPPAISHVGLMKWPDVKKVE